MGTQRIPVGVEGSINVRQEESPLVASASTPIEKSTSRSEAMTLMLDFANVLKAFIGTNFLSLPYAYAQAGITGGTVGLVIVAIITQYCCQLLVQCKRSLQQRGRALNYGEVGRSVFGSPGFWTINFFLVFTQYGFCIGYVRSLVVSPAERTQMIFLATNVGLLLPSSTPVWVTFLLPIPYLVPIAFIKHVKQLAIFSFIADGFLLFSMVMFYRYDTLAQTHDVETGIEWRSLPVFFGMAISSYEGIGLVLPIEESMSEHPRRFPRLLIATLAFVSLLLGSFGLLGYLTYGRHVCSVLSKNLPSTGTESTLLKIALLIAVLFTYPLQLVPVMEVSERYLFRQPANNYFDLRRNVWRAVLVFSTALVAYFVPFFGLLASLIGAFGSSSLAFIIPAVLHMRVFNRTLRVWELGINVGVIVFGVAALVLGTFLSIKSIILEFTIHGGTDACDVHN